MLVIGSRGSQLALWQARHIQAQLESLGETCRIEIIQTTGDRVSDIALSKVGTKGLFTKEIEEALLVAAIDLAVHSLKDMPSEMPQRLTLAAIPAREDPHDALVGGTLASLPNGARVGTSSLRRSAQLRALRPDLQIEIIRGNVDTRLRKLDDGQYAAIVLAAAGLRRLGWQDRITELLGADQMCPAAGQGALAVETRDDGGHAFEICKQLDVASVRQCVTAERAFLAQLGGGCQVPIGAFAENTAGELTLQGLVIAPDASAIVRGRLQSAPSDAERIGRKLGAKLLDQGAREILAEVYAHP